jgi:prepilin-type N-terminal cleavage/methylation domain-containing protein
MKRSPGATWPRRPSSFSLIELLTVIAIIAILAGLTIAAFTGVERTALRNRARNEIQAMGSALESYKADNGGYPIPAVTTFSTTNVYVTAAPNLLSGIYQQSSATLYEQLSGYTNVNYIYGTYPTPPSHVYYAFSPRQLGNNSTAATAPVFVQDPFGNSYGYFNGNGTNMPFNGTNQYDLWSTAGDTGGTNMPGWVTDWAN